MIIDENKVSTQSVGMKETVSFTANLDGMMFDNMINGIYSDKIAAPIRELSTNARDGHAATGTLDTPFDVFLPTRMEPEFKVRDYGCSLSHEEILHMYSVLGMSTKRDTNEQTGCLGLGSKSPFAYTSTFAVTCWQNGKKRVYSAYKNDGGTPAISLVHETNSKEPTGVEVAFAVRSSDVEAFNETAKKVFVGFKPRPNVIRHSSSFEWDERTPLINSEHAEIFSRENKYGDPKSYAVQGSVSYPLTLTDGLKSAIKAHPDTVEQGTGWNPTYAEIELLKNTDMRLYFDIGELTMTTSREELAYDEKTCKNIATRLNQIVKEQEKTINNIWEGEQSLYAATVKFSKDTADGSTTKTIADIVQVALKPKWKGHEIWASFKLYNKYGKLGIERIAGSPHGWKEKKVGSEFNNATFTRMKSMQTTYKFGDLKPSFAWTKAQQESVSGWFHCINDDYHFFVQLNDDTLRINNRIRKIWRDECGKYSVPIYITVKSKKQWDQIRKILMLSNKNYTWMHTVEELKMPKAPKGSGTAAAVGTVDVRKITPSRWGSNQSSARQKIDLNDKTTKYVRIWQKGNSYFYKKSDWEAETDGYPLQTVMYNLVDKAKYIDKTIIALNKQNAKLDKDFGHLFIDYSTELANALKSKLPEAQKLIERTGMEANLGSDKQFYEMIAEVDETILPKFLKKVPSTLRQYTRIIGMQLSGEERELLHNLETAFPDKIKAMRDNQAKQKGLELVHLSDLFRDYPTLAVLYRHYKDQVTRTWGHNVKELKAEHDLAMTDYMKLLKKGEK